MLPRKLGVDIGHDLCAGLAREQFGGIGGLQYGWKHSTAITIVPWDAYLSGLAATLPEEYRCAWTVEPEVWIAEQSDEIPPLVGRAGVFDCFKICFENQTVGFERP